MECSHRRRVVVVVGVVVLREAKVWERLGISDTGLAWDMGHRLRGNEIENHDRLCFAWGKGDEDDEKSDEEGDQVSPQ